MLDDNVKKKKCTNRNSTLPRRRCTWARMDVVVADFGCIWCFWNFNSKLHHCCNLHWFFKHVFELWAQKFNVAKAYLGCMDMFLKLSLWNSIIAMACICFLDMFLKLWAEIFCIIETYFGFSILWVFLKCLYLVRVLVILDHVLL